jgi:hypothetical protein
MLLLLLSKSGSQMSASPKTAKNGKQQKDEDLGLWVDSALISRLHSQPSKSPTHMVLHYADLAFGTVKPDKFQSQKVSKTRNKK